MGLRTGDFVVRYSPDSHAFMPRAADGVITARAVYKSKKASFLPAELPHFPFREIPFRAYALFPPSGLEACGSSMAAQQRAAAAAAAARVQQQQRSAQSHGGFTVVKMKFPPMTFRLQPGRRHLFVRSGRQPMTVRGHLLAFHHAALPPQFPPSPPPQQHHRQPRR